MSLILGFIKISIFRIKTFKNSIAEHYKISKVFMNHCEMINHNKNVGNVIKSGESKFNDTKRINYKRSSVYSNLRSILSILN